MPRKNKSKPEIIQDMQQIQKTNHLREVLSKTVHPILLELNNTIGFTKIFMQTAAMTVESESSRRASDMKVSELIPRLNEVFSSKENETEQQYVYYRKLFESMKDESVKDFVSVIEMTPRYIERYFTQEVDKKSIMELPFDKVLG